MGNSDKWTTPKQIKIEREGEPRGTRRGMLRKGERRKGRKARIDEILSARNEARRYAQYILDDRKRRREHPEWYKPVKGYRSYNPEYEKWFDRASLRLNILIIEAVQDGVVESTDIKEYEVMKP